MEPTFHSFKQYIEDNTQKIESINKNGVAVKTHLDEKGRKICVIGPHNYWKVIEYDSDGNMVYCCDSEGNWEKRKYRNGSLSHISNSTGVYHSSRIFVK
jgi:hypothetical protein